MDSRTILGVMLSVLFAAPAAEAQHVIDRTALDHAVQNRITRDRADRETLLAFLARSEVRELAERTGLSLTRAETAARTLGPDDVRDLAHEARRIDDGVVGGSVGKTILTVVITVALLLVLLSLTLTTG
jgi:hypothetical protein